MNGQTSYRNGQTSFYEWTDVSPISSTARRSEGRFIPVQMRLNKHAEGWGGWGGSGGGLLCRSTAVHSSASPPSALQ